MDAVSIIRVSVEGIKLLSSAIEAAQAGNEREALAYLAKVATRARVARRRWEASKRFIREE